MESSNRNTPFCERFLNIEYDQCRWLDSIDILSNPAISCVYNPLIYARNTHEQYIKKYCQGPKNIVFLGMNPGPFGMAQTGVPFGEVNYVREWLEIDGEVGKPVPEHPKRPVLGMECKRSEVSGQRFWGFFKEICRTPDVFFHHCFVHNYCPLAFIHHSGKNMTPPQLNIETRNRIAQVCNRSLRQIVQLVKPDIVVGVGKYAEDMAKQALESDLFDVSVCGIMHPSPCNPKANKGWRNIVREQLEEFGVTKYLV